MGAERGGGGIEGEWPDPEHPWSVENTSSAIADVRPWGTTLWIRYDIGSLSLSDNISHRMSCRVYLVPILLSSARCGMSLFWAPDQSASSTSRKSVSRPDRMRDKLPIAAALLLRLVNPALRRVPTFCHAVVAGAGDQLQARLAWALYVRAT